MNGGYAVAGHPARHDCRGDGVLSTIFWCFGICRDPLLRGRENAAAKDAEPEVRKAAADALAKVAPR